MPDDTLSKLPANKPSSKGGGMSFMRKMAKQAKPAKPKLAVTEAKKAAKLLQDLGQTVTGISMSPDGGFVVTAAVPGAMMANEPNEWD